MRSTKSPPKGTAARLCLSARPSSSAAPCEGAVEPDHLAVDHPVLTEVQDQRGIFGGPAEPAREWNAGGKALLDGLRQSLQHRRLENTRGDRDHPHPIAGQLARR